MIMSRSSTLASMALVGTARAFGQPALVSYFPELTRPAERARMNAWQAATFQASSIMGPAVAGC
jgi:MFS family permease